ncbi:MAG TPA: hypothetical protein VIG66_08895 [Noviherbaspirillum sp.]
MKWYYEWRLRRVRAQIASLEEETRARLIDDYTAHSRLRVLRSLATGLQKRLTRYAAPKPQVAPATPPSAVAPLPASKEAC